MKSVKPLKKGAQEAVVKDNAITQSQGTIPDRRRSFYNDITEHDNKYCRTKRDDDGTERLITLSNFTIEPLERIIGGDGSGEIIRAHFISERGTFSRTVELTSDIWSSRKDFLATCPGIDFTFVGSDKDVQLIKNLVSRKDFPTRIGYSTIGFHKRDHDWLFLTNEGAISKKGIIPDILCTGKVRDFHTDIISTPTMSHDELKDCLICLSQFNHDGIVAPVIAWSIAALFKARLHSLNVRSFPLLAISGEAGSGKTETIRKIILRLYGALSAEKSLPGMTSFTLMLLTSASNALPLFLDEYKPSKLTEHKRQMISEYIRTSYNSLSGDRGRPDLSKLEFQYLSPTVIAGEDRLIETAVRERILEVTFIKAEAIKHSSQFHKLNGFNLSGLGRLVIDTALKLSDQELLDIFNSEYAQVDDAFTGRYRTNVAVGRFGLKVLDQISLEHTGLHFPITSEHLEESQRANLLGGLDKENVVDRIVSRLLLLINESRGEHFSTQYLLRRGDHYYMKGSEIRIHLESVYPIFLKWTRDYPSDIETLSKEGFLAQVKHQSYYVDYKPAQIMVGTTRTKRCLILDLELISKKGIDIYELKEIGSAIESYEKHTFNAVGNQEEIPLHKIVNESQKRTN